MGSVAVSGAMGEEDEYCAIKGVIESGLGFKTNPETHICTTMKDTEWFIFKIFKSFIFKSN